MSMRRVMVAGNWKMHGSFAGNRQLVEAISAGLPAESSVDVAVFVPGPYLAATVELVRGSPVAVGAQDVSVHEQGAYTGETSSAMIGDCGATMTLVGHSERRTLHGESNEQVALKAKAALGSGLTPVVCIGETLAQREAGTTEAVVAEQIDAVIDQLEIAGLGRCVLAYEPVWAIGTGVTASPEQAQDVHAFIRSKIAALDATIGGQLRILYGGSVKGSNAGELFAMADIDGGLIGGASLSAENFLPICHAGEQA
ncbi:MAG: triose-phosphate isomerase [Pseudomonadota bacterium]